MAFIVTVVVCFLLMVTGMEIVQGWLPNWFADWALDSIAALSFLSHYQSIAKGVLDLRDVFYFLILIAGWLIATAIVIDLKKAS